MMSDKDDLLEISLAATEKYSGKAQELQKDIQAAVQQVDYSKLKNILQVYMDETKQLQTELRQALAKVGELESLRARHELYSERWWQQKRKAFDEVFRDDPEQGFQQWLKTYVDALIAWELATCKRLVKEPFPFPPQASDVLKLLDEGIQAIEDEHYYQALHMLAYLSQITTGEPAHPLLDEVTRAVLLVFEGRIYLYEASESDIALGLFEQARQITPDEGLSFAALGNYYTTLGDSDRALPLYQRAIALSPKSPDGYIGLGLLSEAHGAWDEATDWYEEAIEAVGEVKDIEVALSKLLAPVSGNLYLQLARMLKKESPERSLRAVERAITLGIKHDGQYPERLGYRLKGEILEDLKRKTEAAEAFFEAGRRFTLRNELQIAVELLTHAVELDGRITAIYWDLAHALLLKSSRSDPPYVDEETLDASVHALEAGMQLKPSSSELSWVYFERALINQQRASLPGEDRWSLWWGAIAYLERALLLNEKDAYSWAFLGRYHRFLETNANALEVTKKAIEYDPTNLSALEERAAILANVGKFSSPEGAAPVDEGAEAMIDRRQAIEKSGWVDAVKVYVLLHMERYEDALKLAKSVVNAQPDDIWSRSLLARCYNYLDDVPHATEECEKIWKRYVETDVDNRGTFADAAYFLNKFDEAIRIYTIILEEAITPSGTYWDIGLCYLARGDRKEGEEYIERSIALITNERQLDDMLKEILHTAEKLAPHWSHFAQVQDVFKRIEQEIRKRKEQIRLEPAPTVEAELKRVIEEHPLEEGKINQAWIGTHAGLGRLYADEKRWYDSAASYQLLQHQGERFPEARHGLEKAFDQILEESTALLKENKIREAKEHNSHLLALQLLPDDTIRLALLYNLHGYIHFKLTENEQARTYFLKAIEQYRKSGIASTGSALGKATRTWLSDAAQYWELDADWQVWADNLAVDDTLRSDLTAARNSLRLFLEDLYSLSAPNADTSAEWAPLVYPIAIEVGSALVPVNPGEKWPLIASYVPRIRQQLKESFGITIPGVNIRDNLSLEENRYVLLLDEIPLARGITPLDMRYCPTSPKTLQELSIPAEALIEFPHPLTEQPGCWVKREGWDLVASNNLELWEDPFLFISYHLQSLLLKNLAQLLTVQDVENLLVEWQNNQGATSLIATALPDLHVRYHFTQVMRRLVAEYVPVKQWKEILETVRDIGFANDDFQPALRAIRSRLKQVLPGNDPNIPHYLLPSDLEDAILAGRRVIRGREYPDPTDEEKRTILSLLIGWFRSIESEAAPRNWRITLVTRSPFVRAVISRFFFNMKNVMSNVMVLSQEELLSEDLPVVAAQTKEEDKSEGVKIDGQ